jgi:RNA polymerase-binding transcription factor DksA
MPNSKKTPAKKPAAKAPVKKPSKAAPAKAAPAKAVATKPVAGKPAAKPVPKPSAKTAAPAKGPMTAADLKRKILERKSAGPAKSIAFSLDEVREIAKKNEKQVESTAKTFTNGAKTSTNGKAADPQAKLDRPHKPHHVKPASLADILGFNPNKGRKPALQLHEDEVPEKFRRYYRLLLDLRNHVLAQLGEHTEETLLKSSKEDSGDLSGYGQHMADAGTDTFDRDFALSLVSSEQEALSEIEAAIKRIHDGTYGICETTQKPIAKERLLAVPFTRYSAEAKKQVERHSHRSDQRGGLFGDTADEDGGGKVTEEDSSDE